MDTGSVYSQPEAGDLGPPSLPANPHLPLARFLYSSDSNLSGLEAGVGRLDLANHPLTKWQEAQGSYNKTVLRPCDQYPDLGPVVRRRDRSVFQCYGVSFILGGVIQSLLYFSSCCQFSANHKYHSQCTIYSTKHIHEKLSV